MKDKPLCGCVRRIGRTAVEGLFDEWEPLPGGGIECMEEEM